jgi:hypothetical protein
MYIVSWHNGQQGGLGDSHQIVESIPQLDNWEYRKEGKVIDLQEWGKSLPFMTVEHVDVFYKRPDSSGHKNYVRTLAVTRIS